MDKDEKDEKGKEWKDVVSVISINCVPLCTKMDQQQRVRFDFSGHVHGKSNHMGSVSSELSLRHKHCYRN